MLRAQLASDIIVTPGTSTKAFAYSAAMPRLISMNSSSNSICAQPNAAWTLLSR